MPVQEALEHCEALLDAVREDRIAEARFLPILGVLHAMQGDFEDARRLYRRSHELMAELGRNMTVAASSQESSRIELLAGDPAAAESELRRDYATLETVGERYIRSTIAGQLGHVLIELGRDDEADTFVALAADLAGADDLFSQVVWRTARARLLARAGRFDEGVATGLESVAMASHGAYIEQEADARLHLAEILALAGRPEDAHQALGEAAALYERKGDLTMAAVANGRLDRLLSRP
jgi:tetratricopeptide (TPR) repeat protein